MTRYKNNCQIFVCQGNLWFLHIHHSLHYIGIAITIGWCPRSCPVEEYCRRRWWTGGISITTAQVALTTFAPTTIYVSTACLWYFLSILQRKQVKLLPSNLSPIIGPMSKALLGGTQESFSSQGNLPPMFVDHLSPSQWVRGTFLLASVTSALAPIVPFLPPSHSEDIIISLCCLKLYLKCIEYP